MIFVGLSFMMSLVISLCLEDCRNHVQYSGTFQHRRGSLLQPSQSHAACLLHQTITHVQYRLLPISSNP